ncbi:MAG TPA: valine--tRNA ligase [Polyangiaceae bacterium]|nr:valine--tRNA ligase [Polyangiaceae bacterium]
MAELPKAYEPASVEPHWYAFWEEHGVFRASLDPKDTRPVYVIPMPPPNVTGSLHMGHALYTIQDVIIRHARMRGFNALWQPGIDHAGISTQVVVERQLKREGKTRHDLGREAFIERVFAWKEQSGGRILQQMRVLGFSADWERSKFTMDADMSRAVREAFVRLYEEGLIYRATRLVNWDVESQTVLSDLEVETEENVQGELYEFAYPVLDADPALGATELVVATTRPETMLGDTAVAVHPDDPRYTHLHGKKLKHPFVAREIPVITDPVLVDMAFGTGAVKVTPAHDFNDFATGKRHGLAEISVIGPNGTMNAESGEFAGLDRFAARKAVKKRLAELGLARGSKPHTMTLPRSQRTNSVVEPMISTQWFVKMEPLAVPALEAVRSGRTRIVPEEWVKTWEHWLTNIQDWCISRQLWWGHQIPAFYCGACNHVNVTRDDPKACEKCGSADLKRDADVLDTWFSSGLWPFSTLGWPDKTLALERFYPASDLETGYDILFFWVARMLMLGLKFMGDVPFRRVLLHGMVVDETGDKMSKVKGNTLDPLDLVHGAEFENVVKKSAPDAPLEEALVKFKKAYPSAAQMGKGFAAYGTDALRLTLVSYSPQAKRIALSPARIDGYRRFCNKLYNATRFALTYVEGETPSGEVPAATLLQNRWILSRFARAVTASSTGIEEFRLDDGSGALYHFVWDELCDWFLEMSKPVFAQGTDAEKHETRAVLAHVLEGSLRALHPYAPFVTEELWQRLPRPASRPVSIALAPYPTTADGRPDDDAERDMALLMSAIGAARASRSEHGVHPSAKVPLELRSGEPRARELFMTQARSIEFLVGTAGSVVVAAPGGARPAGTVLEVTGDIEVLVGLRGLVEKTKEEERIERGLKSVEKDIGVMTKRLENKNFVANAPPEVVAEAKQQLAQLERQRARLLEARGLVDEL